MIINISSAVAQKTDEELSMWRLADNSTHVFNGESGPEWRVYIRSTKVTPEDMIDGQDPAQIERMQIVAITEDRSVCVEYRNEPDFAGQTEDLGMAEYESGLGDHEDALTPTAVSCAEYFKALLEAEPNDITASLFLCSVIENGVKDFEIQPSFELPADAVCSDPAWAKMYTFYDIPKANGVYEPFDDQSDPVRDSAWMDANLLYYNGYRAKETGERPAGLEFSRYITPAVNCNWHVHDWSVAPEKQIRDEMVKGLYDETYIYGPKFGESQSLYLGHEDSPLLECSASELISTYQALRKAQMFASEARVVCPQASVEVRVTDEGAYVVAAYVSPESIDRAGLVALDAAIGN